jgi:hypothetical protein
LPTCFTPQQAQAASNIKRKKTKKEERILPLFTEEQKQHQRAGFFKVARVEPERL